jgi:hypothetical protein
LLNVLWIVFRGLWRAIGWCVAAIIIIIGLPWTRAAFTIAAYTLLPFGQKAVSRGTDDVGTGPLGVIGRQRTLGPVSLTGVLQASPCCAIERGVQDLLALHTHVQRVSLPLEARRAPRS